IARPGASWMGHVFVIEEVKPDGTWETIGGNQGREGYGKVSRETVDPHKAKVLGVRLPVAATVSALRQAGSTEIKGADAIQMGTVVSAGAVAAQQAVQAIPDIIPPPDEIVTQLTTIQQLGESVKNVGELAGRHWYVAFAILAGLAWFAARRWKLRR